MITNAAFQAPGASPGLANGWTLRSSCGREAIAPFAPGDSQEGFERWWSWTGALGTAAHAPFAPNGTVEDFDAWPDALFAFELSDGLVAHTTTDGFEVGWWEGMPAFAWSAVPAIAGVFAGGISRESFEAWQTGAVYLFAFPPAALTGAVFADGAVENFTTWTTTNTTLG